MLNMSEEEQDRLLMHESGSFICRTKDIFVFLMTNATCDPHIEYLKANKDGWKTCRISLNDYKYVGYYDEEGFTLSKEEILAINEQITNDNWQKAVEEAAENYMEWGTKEGIKYASDLKNMPMPNLLNIND